MLTRRVAASYISRRNAGSVASHSGDHVASHDHHDDAHHHHEFEPPKSFITGGGARRQGGFSYGGQVEWFGTGYSMSKGSLTGLPYYSHIYGGVPEKFIKIDYNNHLACKDYYSKVGFFGMMRYALMSFLFRATVVARFAFVFVPVLLYLWYLRRFEPVEARMDRETFFRDFDSNYYGSFYNHHAFSERLARRRAKKWGYEGQVVIPHAHH